MAHNINFNSTTGRYSFFSVKEKAWHGLGQIVEQYPTSGEAIKHAGLDYEVAKRAHVKNMGRSLKFEKKNKWIFQYFLPFYLKDYYLILTSLNSKNWVICKQKKIVFISI